MHSTSRDTKNCLNQMFNMYWLNLKYTSKTKQRKVVNFYRQKYQKISSTNKQQNKCKDPLHIIINRDKFEKLKNYVYRLIACPTFVIMGVSLQRILCHFSSSLSLIILKGANMIFNR